jgi:hypothetical protein
MADLPLVTREFVRSIERQIAEDRALSVGDPNAVKRIGQTIAINVPGRSWMNGVFGFGPDDLTRLAEILAFYADGPRPPVYLSPTGFTADVARSLHDAGYVPASHAQTVLYGLPLAEPPTLPHGMAIEIVDEQSVALFADTTAEGFEWPMAWRTGGAQVAAEKLRQPGFHACLIRVDGQVAGSAVLQIRDGIAAMRDAAVIKPFSGRGCHLAMLRHRLHVAHQEACAWVLGAADFDSASFRNQQRAGLRLAYVETTWKPVS